MLNNFDNPQQYGIGNKNLIKSMDAETLVDIWKTVHTSEEAMKVMPNELVQGLDYFVCRYVASTLPFMESDIINHEETAQESLVKIVNTKSADYKRLVREKNYINAVEEKYKANNN
jgi:hypothetical protein